MDHLHALHRSLLICMLCGRMQAYTFLFFGIWVLIATAYQLMFLPETRGVHIDRMSEEWARHWFWGKL